MTLRLMPDVEALVGDYYRGHASITALVGTRVSTTVPAQGTDGLQLTLVTGNEIVRTHLDEQIIDVAAWDTTKEQANLLIRTARAVLLEASRADHVRGVVTHVRTVITPRWLPDDSVNPPRPRYVGTFGVFVHPHKM